MLATGTGVVATSSAGRLFDAVSALIGLRQKATFEGQAAMELEFAIAEGEDGAPYPFDLDGDTIDWAPMLRALLAERDAGVPTAAIAGRFHDTLAAMIVAVARREGLERVCLTGGCFQNRALAERTIARLREAGFTPYWHQRVPPNDGGIALGQLVAAAHALARARGAAND
jgi:hydrogenase maturation protein HypF